MPSRPLAIFRCDAAPSIGGGHAVRSLALAHALHRDGWKTTFAVSDATVACAPGLATTQGGARAGFNSLREEAARLGAAWPDGCDLLVIDHYGWDCHIEHDLKGFAKRLLVVDDLANRPHVADLLVDQTLGRKASEYEALVPPTCHVMTGTDYAILRPAFAAHRHHLKRQRPHSAVSRILISLGLADPQNVTRLVLDGIAASAYPGKVDVVLGPNVSHLADVRERERTSAGKITLHVDVDAEEMARLIAASDLVIGAGGTSSYERACLGAPALLIELADNQRFNIAAFARKGAALSLGPVRTLAPATIADAIDRLASDPTRGATMRDAALALLDGRGAQRIALALRPELSHAGASMGLRLVTGGDAELLHGWQAQPATRRYARNPRVPAMDEHVTWLRAKLADAGCLFHVVLAGDEPVGFVRLDAVTSLMGAMEAYEVSIAISADRVGAGFGLAALRLARRLVPDAEIQAVVLPENAASLKLFRKAGYAVHASGRLLSLPSSSIAFD